MTNWPDILSIYETIPPEILSFSIAVASIIGLLLLILILFRVFRRPRVAAETQIQLQNLNEKIGLTDQALRQELVRARAEASIAASSLREELMSSVRTLSSTLSEVMTSLSESQAKVQQDRLEQITKQHESLRTTSSHVSIKSTRVSAK